MVLSSKAIAIVISAGIGVTVLSAATATLVVKMLPADAPPPVSKPVQAAMAPDGEDEVVALLRELVEAERRKQAREAQQEAASRRYRGMDVKDSPVVPWEPLPRSKPSEPTPAAR
ncbi:MAG TPA: hypothetical protein VK524_10845 [Polyangiaceae bacterium]|nr:hypothetical protein [Polyangiaceae bacterium]